LAHDPEVVAICQYRLPLIADGPLVASEERLQNRLSTGQWQSSSWRLAGENI
jgi:hypothetical protein